MSKPAISPEIVELCRRATIVSYLEKRGVDVISFGQKSKCVCPLPGHKENTPSFNIWPTDDGGQVFKCFGCSATGNIISLIAKIEGRTNGDVVKQLCRETGVELGEYDPSTRVEPGLDEVEAIFCQEDDEAIVTSIALRMFIRRHNGSEDAIDKAMRMYQMIDDFTEHGDNEFCSQKYKHLGIEDLYGAREYILRFISNYRTNE